MERSKSEIMKKQKQEHKDLIRNAEEQCYEEPDPDQITIDEAIEECVEDFVDDTSPMYDSENLYYK